MTEPASQDPATATFRRSGSKDGPPVLPDRWHVIASLGSGGQATVWLAEDRLLEQRVALKVFRPAADREAQLRWAREVRLGRQLSHPHLIRLYDLVEVGGLTVAVMEWVSGGALGRKVTLEGPQPVADVEHWCRQILDVLAYLHDRRIVHRDVKPSNLLLDDSNDVRLADLGLVRSLDTPSDLTRSNTGLGTPSYMAPEQLCGGPPQPSWDLYALGVTCYQLLTGVRPFAGDSEFETADGHLHRRPRSLRSLRPECPPWLARFVERLLAKRPEDRWPTAREALTAFEQRRAGIAPTRLRRRMSAAAGALALVIAVVAGGRLVLRPGGDLALLDVVDDRVVARDVAGEVLWRRSYAPLVPVVLHGDMSPIPGSEALILASPRLDTPPPAHALLDVVTSHDETILFRELGADSELWFPDVSDLWQVMHPSLADVDGDRYDEAVYAVSHPLWYPTTICVSDTDQNREFKFPHSGRLNDLEAVDLDGNGALELVATGVNNPLGFQNVVMIVSPTDRLTGQRCVSSVSPDLAMRGDARPGGGPGCLAYIVLGSRWSYPRLNMAPSGHIVVGEGTDRVELDRWANPIGSPLEGVGPVPRSRFWSDVAGACGRLRLVAGASWQGELGQLNDRNPIVMAEPPSLAAAALMMGQALAEGGDHRGAAVLQEMIGERVDHQFDLWLRAGEQRLILGERDRGRQLVRRALPVSQRGRTSFDQILVLGLDAVIFGDDGDVADTLQLVEGLATGRQPGFRNALLATQAFFTETFDDRALVAREWDVTLSFADVLADWAALIRNGDAVAAAQQADVLEARAEVRDLARLLGAVAALRQGEVDDAGVLAAEAARALEFAGHTSFEAFAWLPLARLVSAKCRLAADPNDLDVAGLRWAAERSPATFVGRRAAGILAQHGEQVEQIGR